jgi:hypothetical protein
LRTNRNAAPIEGDRASSHLAGVTVDIARKGMSRKERQWLTKYLVEMRELGLVEAIEERRQSCFHIMVSNRYADWRQARQTPRQIEASKGAAAGTINYKPARSSHRLVLQP